MRRPIAVLVAAAAATLLLSATSVALPSTPPSAITLQRGTTTSTTPLTDVNSSNDVYYAVTMTKVHGTSAMRYIATFDIGTATPGQLFLDWEGHSSGSCDFKMALYKWSRRRFVVGAAEWIYNAETT